MSDDLHIRRVTPPGPLAVTPRVRFLFLELLEREMVARGGRPLLQERREAEERERQRAAAAAREAEQEASL